LTDLANPKRSSDSAGADYVERINRAIDFVVRNLEEPIRLEEVARVSCFSQFHFHRVFRALLGETLNQFVKRLRLERALSLMSHEPGRSLTQVAFASGFSSSSDFSRSFKARYGVPPSAFDVQTFRKNKREELQDAITSAETRYQLDRLQPGDNPDGFQVEIREIPARTVAYIRVLNPYVGPGVVDAAERLVAWAEARALAAGQWLGYMWEDPNIVAHENCRYDVAVVVDHVDRAGEVGRFEFPPMLVAQVEVRGPIDLEVRALDWLYGTWLPKSRYVPDDHPGFEAWIGRPFAHGHEHFELYVQVPIKRG
jgi:AraC family transcriptional regulator